MTDRRDFQISAGPLGLNWVVNKPGKKGSLAYVIAEAKKAGHDVVLAHDIDGAFKRYTSCMLAQLPAELCDFHGYELLPENVPRSFYVDLDFPVAAHPDSAVVIGNVHKVVEQALGTAFPTLTYDKEACDVLDACGVAKTGSFAGQLKSSFHIKFPAPLVFENHAATKEFAALVHSLSMSPEYVDTLTFWDRGARRPIIDPAPYMRNQCLRMMSQSKMGDEERPLRAQGGDVNWRQHLVRYYGPACTFLVAQASIAVNDDRALEADTFGNRTSGNDITALVKQGLAGEPLWDAPGDVEFYLSCISNSSTIPQPRIVWFSVCCALKNVGATFALFESWSAKRGPSKTNGVYRRRTWDTIAISPRGYGLPFLRRLAEKCVPGCERIRTNNALQSITRVTLPEGAIVREVYDEQWCKPYNLEEFDVVIEKSAMGTGKTLQVERYIERCNPRRIIAFSPRCIFAESLTSRLGAHKFECYSAHAGNSLDAILGFRSINRLVVQMESLHKLADFMVEDGAMLAGLPIIESFDLVIGDEIESCLKQFSSEKTMTKLKRCAAAFSQILQRAKKIMFLDAFICQRTIATLTAILGEDARRIIYRENTHVPIECRRVAYDCAGISRTKPSFRGGTNAVAAKEDLKFVLLKRLGEGKRIVFVNSSKKFAHEVVAEVKTRFPNLKVRVYAGEGDDELDQDIRDVNTHWAEVVLLIYTSRITVGVNFDLKGFDELFVYGSSWSCNVRDVFQSTMRVRYIKEKAMYYSLYEDKKVGPTTQAAIEEHVAGIKAANLAFRVQWEDAPAWLEQLAVMNIMEDNVHAGNYRLAFNQYLDVTGYERKTLEGVSKDALPDAPNTPDTWTFAYDELPNMGFDEASELRNKICAKEASSRDKATFKRYIFQTKMEESEHYIAAEIVRTRRLEQTPENVAEIQRMEALHARVMLSHALAWSVYCSERAFVIDNIFLEKNETGEHLALKRAKENPYAALVGDEPAKLAAIQRVCKSLGLAHTHDRAEIEADVIVKALKDREADVALLRRLMGVRDQSETDHKIVQGECAKARDTFTAILKAWSGAELKPAGKRRQKRIAGKVVTFQNYGVAVDIQINEIEGLIRKREQPLEDLNVVVAATPGDALAGALAVV